MTPDDIKALRRELGCTARELAAALGVEQATVLAWERAELFPTKKYVDRMNELRGRGPAAIPRAPKRVATGSPHEVLADPELWRIFRKLVAHAAFRNEVQKLAADFDDPAEQKGG